MNYCKHCEHCKQYNKSPFNGKFDYRCAKISSSNIVNPTVQHLKNILKIINKKINKIQNYYNGNISIDLSENYLRDDGIIELSDFFNNNPFLSTKLIKLNLRSNKITEASFPYLSLIHI